MKSLARSGDKAELVARLRMLRPERTGRWGRMSAHQMVCHLADALAMLSGEKAVTPVPLPLPRALGRWLALYTPVPWPPGIPTSPELDQERTGTRPSEFATDLARLEALLERVAARPTSGLAGRLHPALGRMSAAAWMRWAYLHLDHHLRQFGV